MAGYYSFDPTTMGIAEVGERWALHGEKAFDAPKPYSWQLPTASVWPFREYTWDRDNHRAGAVPTAGKDKYGHMVYASMRGCHGGIQETVSEDFVAHLTSMGVPFISGNRWDYLRDWMRWNGWDPLDPGHLMFGRDGSIVLGEGNHRLALARSLSLNTVPIRFHFREEDHRRRR